MDNGKPIRESRDIDVPLRSATSTTTPLGRADRERIPWLQAGRRAAADHPVEFPAADARVEGGAGRAGGNTVVLKPAEYTPAVALAFAEVCREAGLPPGVL
jgi:aldehyde dehydrogenase (NAD+)